MCRPRETGPNLGELTPTPPVPPDVATNGVQKIPADLPVPSRNPREFPALPKIRQEFTEPDADPDVDPISISVPSSVRS